ncbi:MAG: hypothetical protein ACI8QZ_002375 [Chlamydiales bacterium]|jgi:hypothetical protein
MARIIHDLAVETSRKAGFARPFGPCLHFANMASSVTKKVRLRGQCPQSTGRDRIEAFRLAAHE